MKPRAKVPEALAVGAPFAAQSVVRTIKSYVWCDLGAEAAVLHLGSGLYYGLNDVGARVWELIQEPRRVHDLADTILREYEVDRPRCEKDLATFLSALAAAGLIEVGHASAD